MTRMNRRWVLASHPTGMPVEDNWRLEQSLIPSPSDNQILARALYLSVDPYMRGRISAKRGYAKGVEVGELMSGAAVAEVIESNHPDWNIGDLLKHSILVGRNMQFWMYRVLPELTRNSAIRTPG